MKKLLLILILAVFLFFTANVFAQEEEATNSTNILQAEEELIGPGLLPNHPLYFLKSLSEGIGNFFTFGQVNQAQRAMMLAEKRLAEANTLIAQGKNELAQRTMERYQERFTNAFTFAQKAKEAGQNTDEIMAKIAENTLRHQAVLFRVYEQVPEEAQEAVENGVGEILRRIEERRPAVEERINQLQERGVPVPNLPERRQVPATEEGLESLEQGAPKTPAVQDQAESQVPVGTQNQIQEQAREQIPAVGRP